MIGEVFGRNIYNKGTPVVCLHGFVGCGFDFSIVADTLTIESPLLAPNFPDYTAAPSTFNDPWKSALDNLHSFIEEQVGDRGCILIGYSMGGRIALQYALKFQEHLKGLVLIGATPGIEDSEYRFNRLSEDCARATKLINQSIEDFLKEWLGQLLLKSQESIPEPYRTTMLQARSKMSPKSLAHYLETLGTGTMPSAWKRLVEIKLPTLLITGEEDLKFTEIAGKMQQLICHSDHTIIKQAGHAVCFEKAVEFSKVVKRFIEKVDSGCTGD
jgi:2-succinyl-6-hydroxy-2,4-cyclohexadiene-1-carboxylate synthase